MKSLADNTALLAFHPELALREGSPEILGEGLASSRAPDSFSRRHAFPCFATASAAFFAASGSPR